jgi:hypothetical protein
LFYPFHTPPQQFALVVSHLDKQLGQQTWVQVAAFLSVCIYLLAEMMSYYNTATTNELWAANEVITDGVGFSMFFPTALSLLYRQRNHGWTYSKGFCLVLSITALFYPLYNILVDAKMYMTRYAQDQAANKTYFKFLKGLEDAAIRRVPTHETADWSEDMVWMLVYFSVAAWSGIVMMSPPTIPTHESLEEHDAHEPSTTSINIGSSYHHSGSHSNSVGVPLLKQSIPLINGV